jgi:glycosyltransferase involved in cell wall biosynthesis
VLNTLANSPLVSVVTTVYNAESFLEFTLCSLLAQTFKDFEAIVIDDGSTDGSADIVQRLADKDARIRLIRQANQGYSRAVNTGLSAARGPLIAFLDHDDLWRPEKLQRQVERLEQDPLAGLVSCYSALLDDKQCCSGWRFGSHASGSVYRRMRFCDLVAGGSVPLVRREAIERAGNVDASPAIQGRSDWDMWLRLSRHCRFTMVEEILVGYVRRPTNYSTDYQRMIQAGAAVLVKAAAEDPELDGHTLQRARARDVFGIFCLSLADGSLAEAAGLLRHSLSISWVPLALAPRRWGILTIFALARLLPRAVYTQVWNRFARLMFGITPGTPFLREPESKSV